MQINHISLDSETMHGPDDWFTGDVYIDGIASPQGDSRLGAGVVHFSPGARTHWHTHPHGQTIYVLEGIGRCQSEGGSIVEIRPGDSVFFEPGENHWHGAAPTRCMSHIAMQVAGVNGPAVWGDPVSDAEYTDMTTLDGLDRGPAGRVGPNPDTHTGI